MVKAPAFQMYAQDFDMDTASWSNDEVGIYIRLLNYEWVNGGLPNDIQELARITREKRIKFEQKWIKNVSKKFQENGQGMLINRRMEEVRQNQHKYSESRRKNVSTRYKSKPTYEEHMNLHTPCSSSSSSNKENIIKEKTSYGEFQNVKLTDNEYQKLLSLFGPDQCKERIESLSQYIASKGKKYSSHYATILSWERKNKNKDSKTW